MSEYIVDVGDADEEYVAYFKRKAEMMMGNPIREEIVRCRDCEWLVETSNPISSTGWWCVTNDTPRGLDGFCDWAIRRSD